MSDGEPVRDLDRRTPRRSTGVLVLAIGLAVGAGGLAALLKDRAPKSPTVSPTGSISVPVPDETTTPDPVAARDRLLEQLLDDARSEPNVRSLPAFAALSIPCRRGQPACDEVVARLTESGVPPHVVLAFAEALRKGDTERFDRLVAPLLASEDEAQVTRAIDLLRERGRASVASDPACGCGFGVAPVPLGDDAWLFAVGRGAALAWEPEETEQGWSLGLRRDPEGVSRLHRRVEVGGTKIRIEASPGGAAIEVGGDDGDP